MVIGDVVQELQEKVEQCVRGQDFELGALYRDLRAMVKTFSEAQSPAGFQEAGEFAVQLLQTGRVLAQHLLDQQNQQDDQLAQRLNQRLGNNGNT